MGIGAALAIGFLQGTNEKMAKKREAELQAKADERDMQQKLVEAVLGMDDVDFGAPGTQDFFRMPSYQTLAGISRTVDDVENKLAYGNFSIAKPEDWDKTMNDGDLFVRGSAWLRFHNDLMANPGTRDTFIAALEANPGVKSAFMNDLARYSDYYADGYVKKNTNVQTGAVSGYVPANENYKDLYEGISGFMTAGTKDPVNDKIIANAESSGDIQSAGTSLVVTVFKDNKEERVAFDFGDKYSNLERMAEAMKYNDVQSFVDDFQDYTRAESAEEAYSILLAGAELEALNAGKFNRTAGVNNMDLQFIGVFLEDKFGADRFQMAQAMATLMVLDEDSQKNGNSRYTKTFQPAAHYFEKYLKLDIGQLEEQYNASQETVRNLRELQALVDKESTPTGFASSLKSVFGGAFGEKGQLEQLLGVNTLGLSSGEMLQRAEKQGFISTSVLADLSEIDALKLTLAAQMARAVDPSGRLSNQDFEVQLRRLGQDGFFTSKVQAQTKLKAVIDDFEKRLSRMQVLHEVATSGTFGAREARILKADRAVQQALDSVYIAKSRSLGDTSPETPATPVPEESAEKPALILDKDINLYTDGAGNYYHDPEGTRLVSDEEFLEIFNKAFQ